MRFIVVVAFLAISISVSAAEERLMGFWEGGDTAAMSIYGTMLITKKHISWGKNYNFPKGCKLAYEVEKEESGVKFKDQIGNEYVTEPNSEFATYILRIKRDNCATGLSKFRLTFPNQGDTSYLAMVEYNLLVEPVGWMHFFRREPKRK